MSDVESYITRSELLLKECEQQFRFYAQQHRAKGTPESLEKAKVNESFAARISSFLDDGS